MPRPAPWSTVVPTRNWLPVTWGRGANSAAWTAGRYTGGGADTTGRTAGAVRVTPPAPRPTARTAAPAPPHPAPIPTATTDSTASHTRTARDRFMACPPGGAGRPAAPHPQRA